MDCGWQLLYLKFLYTSYCFAGVGMGNTVPADIIVSPSGPLRVIEGSTVVVNCTRGPNYMKPNIRWRLPWSLMEPVPVCHIVIDYLFVFVGAVFVALRSEEPDLIP